ncbi:MAG TPA: histidine kinase [Lacunisphaera sp.]|nr:histidine kinase [Lacunisphaera sp.]
MMRARCLSFLALLGAGALPAAAGDAPAEAIEPRVEFRFKLGDDPRWSARDWDDSDWPVIGTTDGRPRPRLEVLPARAGVFWMRYRVERSTLPGYHPGVASYLWPRDEPGAPINSIFLPGTLSYELYWDGRLIGRAGVVGNSRETEIPGPLDNTMLIPEELLGPGPHVVAMRASNYHYNFPADRVWVNLTMGNYTSRLKYEARRPIIPMVGASCSLLVAVICASLFWFVDRRQELVICGLLGFMTALFFTLIAWRWLHQDPYPWLYYRYGAMLGTMAVMGYLMVWLLARQFAIPHRAMWLLGAVVVVVVVWLAGPSFQQTRIVWLARAMLAYALLPLAWAAWQRRAGVWPALAGVLIGLGSVQQAEDMRTILAPTFFLFFGALVVLLLGTLGWQIQADRRQAREAKLTAARMEIELLKKNLQPHFLLNTLTAVSEVIEQDPKGAVNFIDDLSDEFRSLAQMSGERLVPLQRELELCRTHLKVIARRTGRRLDLQAIGAEESALVPPALFLTLIENGLVYQQADDGAAFRLTARTAADGMNFSFLSPGRLRPLAGRPPGGTGLRYVKARLEESFPGRWTLTQGEVAQGWETIIRWQSGPRGATA